MSVLMFTVYWESSMTDPIELFELKKISIIKNYDPEKHTPMSMSPVVSSSKRIVSQVQITFWVCFFNLQLLLYRIFQQLQCFFSYKPSTRVLFYLEILCCIYKVDRLHKEHTTLPCWKQTFARRLIL